ncbi:MAG: hypothetical protein U9O94_07010 [Nanoarchaeota archaeon]|nr:hypothetical protein [Nanoarchaeota archaeon]
MNNQLTLFDIPSKASNKPFKSMEGVIGGIYLDKGVKPSEATEWLLSVGRDVFCIFDGIQSIDEIVDLSVDFTKLDHYPDYAVRISSNPKVWRIVSTGHKTSTQDEYEIGRGEWEGDHFLDSVKKITKMFIK